MERIQRTQMSNLFQGFKWASNVSKFLIKNEKKNKFPITRISVKKQLLNWLFFLHCIAKGSCNIKKVYISYITKKSIFLTILVI